MNLTQLESFRLLAETQHYAAAAEQLGVEQSSLSRTIASLEWELGVPLFEKRGRNVQITKYGSAFYDHIRTSLDSLHQGITKVKSMADPMFGEICIGLTYQLGPKIVPKIVRDFSSVPENSRFTVRLLQYGTAELITLLKEGKCDLALCSFVASEPGIEFVPLLDSRLVAIVDEKHPLAARKSVSLAELAVCPLILNSEKASFLLSEFQKQGLHPTVLSQVQGECAIAGMVSVGYGVSIVDRNVIESGVLSTGYAINVLEVPELQDTKIKTYLAYQRARWHSPAVQAFLKHLQQLDPAYFT